MEHLSMVKRLEKETNKSWTTMMRSLWHWRKTKVIIVIILQRFVCLFISFINSQDEWRHCLSKWSKWRIGFDKVSLNCETKQRHQVLPPLLWKHLPTKWKLVTALVSITFLAFLFMDNHAKDDHSIPKEIREKYVLTTLLGRWLWNSVPACILKMHVPVGGKWPVCFSWLLLTMWNFFCLFSKKKKTHIGGTELTKGM